MNKKGYCFLFSVPLFFLFGWMAWEARGFAELARFFPLYVSIGGAIFTLIDVILMGFKMRKNRSSPSVHDQPQSVVKYIFWIVGYLVLIYIAGFLIATAVFLFAFLLTETGLKLGKTILSLSIALTGIILFGHYMALDWPQGLIGKFFGL